MRIWGAPELVTGVGARLLLHDGDNPMWVPPDEPQGPGSSVPRTAQGSGLWKISGHG